MRSHAGGVIKFGIGVFALESKMQKLNTKSSTDAEIVAGSDILPKVIYMHLFIEQKGHPIRENATCQDNQSVIKLEINGRKSRGKHTRHVEVRHFYIEDFVDKEMTTVKYCGSNKMLGDYFTKLLQGNLFLCFRVFMLVHMTMSELHV